MNVATIANQSGRYGLWDNILDVLNCVLAMSSQADSGPNLVTGDAKDVTAAQGGDHDAFGRLVEKHQATIAQQMRRFSRDAAVVEELVHDVFVEAYLSLKSYRAQSSLIYWLKKIAVRVGYRYWKRQTREKNRAMPMSQVESVLEQLESEASISASQAHETLHELLHLLSPRDRLVLTLMYWDGCTVAEAAELAGWTKTMVKVQAYRARKRLKQLIEESQL
jgi:RNA polymerase sigma-70 factor (ECF subfamily)